MPTDILERRALAIIHSLAGHFHPDYETLEDADKAEYNMTLLMPLVLARLREYQEADLYSDGLNTPIHRAHYDMKMERMLAGDLAEGQVTCPYCHAGMSIGYRLDDTSTCTCGAHAMIWTLSNDGRTTIIWRRDTTK